jgi:hypothetical protein
MRRARLYEDHTSDKEHFSGRSAPTAPGPLQELEPIAANSQSQLKYYILKLWLLPIPHARFIAPIFLFAYILALK